MSWDFARDGKEIRARPEGQLIVGGGSLAIAAVLAGAGLAYVLEEHASPYIKSGRLVQVLDDWCAPFSGLHLYYPIGRVTPALRALIDALKRCADTAEFINYKLLARNFFLVYFCNRKLTEIF